MSGGGWVGMCQKSASTITRDAPGGRASRVYQLPETHHHMVRLGYFCPESAGPHPPYPRRTMWWCVSGIWNTRDAPPPGASRIWGGCTAPCCHQLAETHDVTSASRVFYIAETHGTWCVSGILFETHHVLVRLGYRYFL